MDVSKKGIALILFGILVSIGSGWLSIIGLPIGFVGLIIVLTDKSGKNS